LHLKQLVLIEWRAQCADQMLLVTRISIDVLSVHDTNSILQRWHRQIMHIADVIDQLDSSRMVVDVLSNLLIVDNDYQYENNLCIWDRNGDC
jgi:hypothetical protein